MYLLLLTTVFLKKNTDPSHHQNIQFYEYVNMEYIKRKKRASSFRYKKHFVLGSFIPFLQTLEHWLF